MTISRGLAILALLLWPHMAVPQDRGPATNLPLPRYVSLKASEANVRRGPSLTHRIDWVFKRRGMPLRVTAEFGHWRRVQDRDGAGGWVHYTLLSGTRTALVRAKMLDMRARPKPDAMVVARLEQDVIARLDECGVTWCAMSAEGYRGWTLKTALWGIEPEETFE
ncbi:MAG: SH3 domain-containing protein [Pseudomonadota bacterium]